MSTSTSTPTPPTGATTGATTTPMLLQRLRFLVHGTVQGVYFRVFTQRSARAHHITGFVYNTTNGKVAGEAQGRPEDLKKLLKELDKGSPGSKVIRVDQFEMDTLVEGESEFEIRRATYPA